MLKKEGRYGHFYFTGRAKGVNTVRWVLKPLSKREMRFRRIPAQYELFELGYWQNVVNCHDSKHRYNIRHPD
jgi:hypothetical protein